jgi:large subunit ribosomal protein L9
MKVLLIKDVYKLGRAGEVKKVANGYGRNYLIPQGFAIPATPGALNKADLIKEKATERRAVLNDELSSVAEVLDGKKLTFAVKAGETGHLYGSINSQDIMDNIKENYDIELEKRQVEMEPLRQLGKYTVPVHLTMDLVPEITIIIFREGDEPGEEAKEEETDAEAPEDEGETVPEEETVPSAETEAPVEPEEEEEAPAPEEGSEEVETDV